MSFTYDIVSRGLVSQVRNLIQDIDPDDYDMEDEDIEYLLEMNTDNVYEAGKEASFRLASKYAKEATKIEVDGIRTEYQTKASAYKAIYEELKDKAKKDSWLKAKGAPIYVGGVNKKDYNANRENDSVVKPAFTEQQNLFNPDFPEQTPIDDPYWNWRG